MQSVSSLLRSRLRPLGLVVLLVGGLVGCDAVSGGDTDPSGPYPLQSADTITVEPGIAVAVQTPDTVTLGDAFPLRARLDNQTSGTVAATTGNAALWEFGVYDGEERLPVKGSMRLYVTVVTEHDIPPGATGSTVDLRAARASDAEPPLGPGTYTARVWVNWQIAGAAITDTVETPIVFVEE